MNETNLKAELVIPFSCNEHARIAYTTLTVDAEPRRELINKTIHLDETSRCLRVNWLAAESRILRVSVNSFLDNLGLVLETIQLFDQ